MSKSPPALVEASLLIWARETARLPVAEVAARLKVPVSDLEAWEAGDGHPTIGQLRKLAEHYRRALAVFFLPEPPKDFESLRDFRRTDAGELALSTSLEADLRRAQTVREAALSLLDPNDETSDFSVSAALSDSPEQVASNVRAALGVADEAQLRWSDSYEALREWRSAVESIGVLVINMSGVGVSEARGFSIAHFPLPLIALNAKDAPNGRLFTLMHELAHLALHEGGICDWTPERRLEPNSRRVESFCNAVAAAILLPEDLVASVIRSAHLPAPDSWTDELIKKHARALCVSEEAFLRRLVDLDYASERFYAAKRTEYLQRYAELAKRKNKPIVTYEKRVVGQLGTAYLDLAFGAYYERRLTLSELSSYTGVRVSNLAKVEREAFGLSRVPGGSQ